MDNNEEEIVYNPSIAKIGKNLYRTTIPETEEIFTGNLDDTLDLLDKNYTPYNINMFELLKKNCEKVNFRRFLNSFREGNSGISICFDGTGSFLYYSNNKIFLCSSEDVEKYNRQILNCIERHVLPKESDKSSTIRWEKRANQNMAGYFESFLNALQNIKY